MQELIGREDFESLLRSLAGDLFQLAGSKMQDLKWLEIVLDVRFDDQGGFIDKIRTPKVVRSGRPIGVTTKMTLLILSLDKLRRELLQDQWYGFRLTVTEDQQCEMVYNYDPNCANDPAFYAD